MLALLVLSPFFVLVFVFVFELTIPCPHPKLLESLNGL